MKSRRAAPKWQSRYVIDRETAMELTRLESMTESSFNKDKDQTTEFITEVHDKFIISKNNPWLHRWDYIIMIIACVNCFMVPVEIAVAGDFVGSHTWYSVTNILIDIVFILDLLVNCNTTYEKDNVEVRERKKIIAHYLKGRFTVDFLSAFPIDVISSFLL